MKIVIVDYGMGNVRSIKGALNFIGISDIVVSAKYEQLKEADKLILPGVGSFGKAMSLIRERKLDIYLKQFVMEEKKPILGICLGMQLLGISSTEDDANNSGLGLINGLVTKFSNSTLKVPHVGFNQVNVNRASKLYEGLEDQPDFYFTHSYKMLSCDNINQSTCNYGDEFIASYNLDNIVGAQFHPELSQYNGLNFLRNFIQKF